MDYINIIFPAIVSLILVIILLSSFGIFSVLEAENATTGEGIIMAIIGIVIILVVLIIVSCLAKSMNTIGSATHGGFAGFVLGSLAYSIF